VTGRGSPAPLRVPVLSRFSSAPLPPCTPRSLISAAVFQSNSLGRHRAGAGDKKPRAGDNARTSGAARARAATQHARTRAQGARVAARAGPPGSRACGMGRGNAPCSPTPTPPAQSRGLRNDPPRLSPWEAGGESGKRKAGDGLLPCWLPEGHHSNRARRERERKGRREEGGRRGWACVPLLGPGAPEARRPCEARKSRRPRGADLGCQGHSQT
jgi:hypothetical protein